MKHILRVAWTIGRRDYVAAVSSRLFLIFVLLPLIFAGIGGAFGALGRMAGGDQDDAPPPAVLVTGDAGFHEALAASRDRLLARVHGLYLPPLAAPTGRRQRLGDGGIVAVASGNLDHPHITVADDAPDELGGQVTLIIEDARATRALGGTPLPPVVVTRAAHPRAGPADPNKLSDDRLGLARGAQYAVLILTIMLAGRLLSSFVEERSNKVIEVLAAVAPVDAIFLGKLTGMLLFSFTCIIVWGLMAAGAGLTFAPQIWSALTTPAIGWPLFAPLLLLYFGFCFLLQGTVLLGLGAHANTPSDLQTLALPTTMAQLGLLGFASIGVAHPDRWTAIAAAIFPWSSPLAMTARAAELPALWPHLLALAWQAVWLLLSIRFAARRFQRGVLKSGGGAKPRT